MTGLVFEGKQLPSYVCFYAHQSSSALVVGGRLFSENTSVDEEDRLTVASQKIYLKCFFSMNKGCLNFRMQRFLRSLEHIRAKYATGLLFYLGDT